MLFLGLVLAASGAGLLANAVLKVMRFDKFVAAVALYAPATKPALVAATWAAAEVTAGAILITPLPLRAVPATWLLGAATGGLIRRVRQGEDHDCGCTGKARKVSPAVIRNNVALIGVLLAAQWAWGGTGSLVAAGVGLLAISPVAFLGVGTRRSVQVSESPAS